MGGYSPAIDLEEAALMDFLPNSLSSLEGGRTLHTPSQGKGV